MKIKEVMEYIGCSRNTVMKYKKKGLLTAEKDHTGKLVFNTKQVKKIVSQYEVNKDANKVIGHKEDISAVYAPPVKLNAKQFLKQDIDDSDTNTELLDDRGQQELMRVTKYLTDKGIIDLVDHGTIMRYAISTQMRDKYLKLAELHQDAVDDKLHPYFTLANNFQKEIQHYEKELGLTAAAASKLNLKEPEEIDEMESILNG